MRDERDFPALFSGHDQIVADAARRDCHSIPARPLGLIQGVIRAFDQGFDSHMLGVALASPMLTVMPMFSSPMG